MIAGSLARRYAKALLAIGIADKNFEQLGSELASVDDLFASSSELRSTLVNPLFKQANRRAVLEELAARLKVSRTIRNFLMLLLDKGRLAALPDIRRELGALIDEQAGRVRAVATSAQKLTADETKRLEAALAKQSGKQIILERREDPRLIGGVVTQLGDLVFDGSVRAQVERMREQLLTK